MNPSSGNLHPTEAYAILPGLEGLSGGAGVYHYAPLHHTVEQSSQRFGSSPLSFCAELFSSEAEDRQILSIQSQASLDCRHGWEPPSYTIYSRTGVKRRMPPTGFVLHRPMK